MCTITTLFVHMSHQANDMIDVYAQYNKVLDLKKLVEVCTTEIDATDHKNMLNWRNTKTMV